MVDITEAAKNEDELVIEISRDSFCVEKGKGGEVQFRMWANRKMGREGRKEFTGFLALFWEWTRVTKEPEGE